MMRIVSPSGGVHPKHERDFGCAVLSPWPLEEPRKLVLPHGARVSGLRRSAVSAVLVRGAQLIRAYSLHLPSPLATSGGSRKDELRALAADAATSELPVLIVGDFNSHDKVEELAKAGFAWVTRDVGDTTRFRLLGITLAGMSYEHVLARGFEALPGKDSVGVVKNNQGASDHRPIWAVLVPVGSDAPQKVSINGASGGVGTFAVQIAKAFGAELSAVCSARNLDMARSIGADHVIDYTKEDFTQGSQRYDLIFAVNGFHPLSAYQRALNPQGMYICAGGSLPQIFQAMFAGPLMSRGNGKRLASMGIATVNQKDLLCLKEFLEAGKIAPVIEKNYPLDEAPTAIRYLAEGHARAKIVFQIG